MSTLGKVLLFLNLLAAAALVYFTTQDWKKRQEINTSVLTYQLTLQGLPLNKPEHASSGDDPELVPVLVRGGAGDNTEWMRKKPFESMMASYTGGDKFGTADDDSKTVVTSLIEELDRVEKKIAKTIYSANDSNKLRMLAGGYGDDNSFVPGLLMNLAETYQEREVVRQLASKLPDEKQELLDYDKAVKDGVSPLNALSFARVPQGERLKANAKLAEDMLKAKLEALKKLTRNVNADSQLSGVRSLSDAVAASSKELDKLVQEYNYSKERIAEVEAKGGNTTSEERQDLTDMSAKLPSLVESIDKAKETAAAAQAKLSEAMKGDSFKTAVAPDEQRRQITHFLMLLDTGADWQNRVAAVTGLRTYAKAVEAQASRLSAISRQIRTAIENDSATFVNDYELLRHLAIEQDKLVTLQGGVVKGLKEMETKDRQLSEARAAHLKKLQEDLAQIQQTISATLDRQSASEKSVFELQRKVSETLRENLSLETDLEKKEQPKP